MSEKKQRSAAQIAAFEKAKAAREGNLRKKFQEEHEQQQRQQEQQQQPDEQQPDEQPSEDSVEQQQHGMYTEDFNIVPMPPGAKAKYPRTRPPRPPPQEDDSDYIELDTDALFSQLEANQREIKELRDHMHGLKQGHDELQSTWQQHDVGRRNELSFV
jgi:hypothetical protein